MSASAILTLDTEAPKVTGISVDRLGPAVARVTWSEDEPGVVSVEADGTVELGSGTATVTGFPIGTSILFVRLSAIDDVANGVTLDEFLTLPLVAGTSSSLGRSSDRRSIRGDVEAGEAVRSRPSLDRRG